MVLRKNKLENYASGRTTAPGFFVLGAMAEKRGFTISHEEAAWIWLQNSAPYPISPIILLQTCAWLTEHPEKYREIVRSIGPIAYWDHRKPYKGSKSQ